jgi:hypothetical protein
MKEANENGESKVQLQIDPGQESSPIPCGNYWYCSLGQARMQMFRGLPLRLEKQIPIFSRNSEG